MDELPRDLASTNNIHVAARVMGVAQSFQVCLLHPQISKLEFNPQVPSCFFLQEYKREPRLCISGVLDWMLAKGVSPAPGKVWERSQKSLLMSVSLKWEWVNRNLDQSSSIQQVILIKEMLWLLALMAERRSWLATVVQWARCLYQGITQFRLLSIQHAFMLLEL